MAGQFGFLAYEQEEGKKLFFHMSEVEGGEGLQVYNLAYMYSTVPDSDPDLIFWTRNLYKFLQIFLKWSNSSSSTYDISENL